ncbi:MAG: hypothetical protein JO023_06325, partial [Chloroflexi bacterium]|nr:hypothetical protein [Chloroflexota bacterium]
MTSLSPVKRALVEIERLQSEVQRIKRERTEPLAIIGLSGRFPGARDASGFWELLAEGREGIVETPPERWNIDELFHPDPAHAGSISSRWGGFLRDIDQFDASFFGVSPREAAAMDPQQRLLLEVTWEAIEGTGLAVDAVAGSTCGVFVGVSSGDYERLHLQTPETLDVYSGTGSVSNMLAGRLAYFFDLRGPALAVDTACSSSLVSVHLACQSLRAGECDVAVAAGVNLFILPERHICVSRMNMLAPDGRCKAFDARADGFVRSEGCGVVLLKRLSEAQAAGDPIRAVIRGSAVTHDGRSAGLTTPNGQAQRIVLRRALTNAGVSPSEVGFVETHGAGTSLGDAIEAEALAAVYGMPTVDAQCCVLGAVKTNIGHTEAAAGVAGLIKTVLVLENELIPRNLHFQRLSPRVPIEGTRLKIADGQCVWPRSSRRRLSAVSSFGLSGTNAHVIVEEAPLAEPSGPGRGTQLLLVSAKTETALAAATERLAEHLASHPEQALADVAYTLAVGRREFEWRRAVVCQDRQEAVARLRRAGGPGVWT